MGASNWIEMRVIDGIEIPFPVAGPRVTPAFLKASRIASYALPYSPKRFIERFDQLTEKHEKIYGSCPLSCIRLQQRFCETHGEVIEQELYFVGKTCIEVADAKRAQKAAEGDLDSQTYITDRIEGKPKQAIEATVTAMSYSDVLAQLMAEEEADPTRAPRITVDPFSTDMNTVHLNPFEDAEDVQPIPRKRTNNLLGQL